MPKCLSKHENEIKGSVTDLQGMKGLPNMRFRFIHFQEISFKIKTELKREIKLRLNYKLKLNRLLNNKFTITHRTPSIFNQHLQIMTQSQSDFQQEINRKLK